MAAHSAPVNGIMLTLIVLVTSIVLVAGLVWASRRLLGLPVGTLRALMAGLLGFAAARPSAGRYHPRGPGMRPPFSAWRWVFR